MRPAGPDMKKKGKLLNMICFALCMIMLLPHAAMAAEQETKAGTESVEDETAKTGFLTVVLQQEEEYDFDVTVELYPYEAGLPMETVTLTHDDPFMKTIRIRPGTYKAVPYLELSDYGTLRAYTSDKETKVTEGGNAQVPVLVGTQRFVDSNAWITDRKDDRGNAFVGVLTEDTIKSAEEEMHREEAKGKQYSDPEKQKIAESEAVKEEIPAVDETAAPISESTTAETKISAQIPETKPVPVITPQKPGESAPKESEATESTERKTQVQPETGIQKPEGGFPVRIILPVCIAAAVITAVIWFRKRKQ